MVDGRCAGRGEEEVVVGALSLRSARAGGGRKFLGTARGEEKGWQTSLIYAKALNSYVYCAKKASFELPN